MEGRDQIHVPLTQIKEKGKEKANLGNTRKVTHIKCEKINVRQQKRNERKMNQKFGKLEESFFDMLCWSLHL